MNTCLILFPIHGIMLDVYSGANVQPRVCEDEDEAASSLSEAAGLRSFHPQLSLQLKVKWMRV